MGDPRSNPGRLPRSKVKMGDYCGTWRFRVRILGDFSQFTLLILNEAFMRKVIGSIFIPKKYLFFDCWGTFNQDRRPLRVGTIFFPK